MHPGRAAAGTSGDREHPVFGSGHPGAPVRLLAIGDSIARGFRLTRLGPGKPDTCRLRLLGLPLRWFDDVNGAYPAQLARRLAGYLRRPVELDRSTTCSGARVHHLFRDGEPLSRLRAAVGRAPHAVTVTLGANDVLRPWYRHIITLTLLRPFERAIPRGVDERLRARLAPSPEQVEPLARNAGADLGGLLAYLRQELPDVPIVVTGYMGGTGSPEIGALFVAPLNRRIGEAVAAVEGAVMLDLDAVFAGHRTGRRGWLSAADGTHPNRRGQRAIAEALAAIIGPRLVSGAPLVA